MMDFNEIKGTATSVKSELRLMAFNDLLEFFIGKVGEENVSIVGNNEIAVCYGTRTLADGTDGEVCFTVKPVAKDFDVRKTPSGKTITPYERMTEADVYEMSKTEKEKKAEEKARAKAEKIKRDKAARIEKAEKKINKMKKA